MFSLKIHFTEEKVPVNYLTSITFTAYDHKGSDNIFPLKFGIIFKAWYVECGILQDTFNSIIYTDQSTAKVKFEISKD